MSFLCCYFFVLTDYKVHVHVHLIQDVSNSNLRVYSWKKKCRFYRKWCWI